MSKYKAIQVIEFGDTSDKGRIYLVDESDFIKANVNDYFEVYEAEDGKYEGFRVLVGNEFEYVLKDYVRVYKEVDFKIVKSEIDGFGEGYNRVIALIDEKETELSACKLKDDYNSCCLVIV